MREYYIVGLYSTDGHWITNLAFYYRWQARLAHSLINRSMYHNGMREY